MLESQTLLLLIPEHLPGNFPPSLTICSQLKHRCKRLPILILMHLLVSLNLVSFALVIFHCLILNFPPIKEVAVLANCLILSLLGMNRPGLVIVFPKKQKVIVFVVVVNSLTVDELAKLLGQLRTSDLSIFLTPKQWFEGEKGDSDIPKLPFSSFPMLVLTPWRENLFLGLKTLFAVMVSELTSDS